MPDSAKFKLTLTHVLNTFYFAAIVIVLLTAFWIYSAIKGFFFPPPKVTSIANAELIGQQVDDTLITSRAHIDAYLILEKLGDKDYVATDNKLKKLGKPNIKIRDKKGSRYRQLCVYSMEVVFGYKSWSDAVSGVGAINKINGWPRITGIYLKRRLSSPDTADVASGCRELFSGTMSEEDINFNAYYIRQWLVNDGVYRSHIDQGINQLVDIALWEASLACGNNTCLAEREKIMAWRDYQLAQSEDPILLALEAEDPSALMNDGSRNGGGEQSLGARTLPLLQAAPVRGVYKETYSSLVFVNAEGRLMGIPFTKDTEMAIQRDVIEVTYGSTIYFQNTVTRGGETTLYASAPSIVMKSLMDSEHAIVARGGLDELPDVLGMSVSDYLQQKTNSLINAEILANKDQAIQTSKTILKQKMSVLKTVTQQGGEMNEMPVTVKFTEVPPDTVGFSDINLTKFLERFL